MNKKKKKTQPLTQDEREFFEKIGVHFSEMEPRGAWIDELIQKKEKENNSSEFTAKDVFNDQRDNSRIWTDAVNKIRRLREKKEVNENIEQNIIDEIMLDDIQRCLRSLRNGGNAISNNGRCDIRSVPPDWSKPHEIPEGHDKYCSAIEFERRCIEALGAEEFARWKEQNSKRDSKGTRRSSETDDYQLEAIEILSENRAKFTLLDEESQEEVGELYIDKTEAHFDVRGPEDLGLTTVRKAIQRYITKTRLLCDVQTMEKVVMFRAKYTGKAA